LVLHQIVDQRTEDIHLHLVDAGAQSRIAGTSAGIYVVDAAGSSLRDPELFSGITLRKNGLT